MRLVEIIELEFPAEPTPEVVQEICSDLVENATFLSAVTSSVALFKKGAFFFLTKNDQVAAWLELGEVAKIADDEYDVIKFIYVLPEFRKTRVVGVFLLALKKFLTRPLILGSDEYGGVLFADGVKLVKSLADSAKFEVKVLDLKTGEKTEYSPAQKAGKFKTLVFETGSFPLVKDAGRAGTFFVFEHLI